MARNEEKAKSMLHRFLAAQAETMGISNASVPQSRPKMISEVSKLSECEHWRSKVITDISRSVTKINNPGLTDSQVRDLNDDINKLMREKRRWEEQIKFLGGPDYRRSGMRIIDNEGKEIPGNYGYRYFGRARDLPGVRELFEPEAITPAVKNRFEIYRNIDADYYGYRDEEDGELIQFEQEIEAQMKSNGTTIFSSLDELTKFGKPNRKNKHNKRQDMDDQLDSPPSSP